MDQNKPTPAQIPTREQFKSHRFSYVQYDQQAADAQAKLKKMFEDLEYQVLLTIPHGRPQALLLTALEEAYMWSGKGIRDAQIARTGRVDEQPHRANE